MSVQAEKIAQVLGTSEVGSAGDLRRSVREGLPYSTFETIAASFGRENLASVLAIPQRTLTRRRQAQRLQPAESDRLVRVARILARAEEVLGDGASAAHWLQRANQSLGGERPFDLLDTDVGSHQVEEILGRIEYGVYS